MPGIAKLPGPSAASYMLPPVTGYKNHDISRYKNPAYTMRIKPPIKNTAIGPGPTHFVGPVTKYGVVGYPAYSIKPRHIQDQKFKTPASNTYRITQFSGPNAPAYRIRSRNPYLKPFQTPAANAYLLPSQLAQRPEYSMRGKYDLKTVFKTPGPGAYDTTDTNKYKWRYPKYSLKPRLAPLKTDKTPGPYFVTLPKKPGYSFGLKTKQKPYITSADIIPCTDTIEF